MRDSSMPIQAPQWTEFLSCPVCYNVFNEKQYRPISLACGHTVCHSCLCKLQQRKCPFDQSLISRDVAELPVNFALLQLVCATALPENKEECVPGEYRKFYDLSIKHLEDLALLLKPVSSSSTGSIITVSTSNSGNSQNVPNSFLSRPMQRKLITLVSCQLVEEEGRARALRAARSLGERTVTELILQHQNPQQLSSNLWASVRGRGCQFLGPAMQEEVLKLILLALEDGSALSRKVLVLFVVQRLETHYPQASKTAIGHVVQLLYRASCFKVTKREEESSLMQLKEEYRTYEMLRREHDSQIVQIAMEAGLRIAPDQWSSLLYGDATHKSHMQSIIDKLQTPQTFSQSVSELLIALQRTGDPHNLQRLQPELEFLSSIDPSPDIPAPSWENLDGVMKAVHTVVEGLVDFLQNSVPRRQEYLAPHNSRYKTSMCRDHLERTNCPRGASCTFAHSDEELEKYRLKHRRAQKGHYGAPTQVGYRVQDDDIDTGDFDNYMDDARQDLTHVLKSMNINVSSKPLIHGEASTNQHTGVGHNQTMVPPNKPDGPMRAEMTAGVEATPVSIGQPIHVVPPTATPLANVVPVDPIGDGVMSPTEDVGIATGGVANIQQNVTPPTVQMGPNMGMGQNPMGNMNIHQGMMPGMVAPNNMGLPQGNPTMMQPMGPMQGMYPPFMPPYGGPGPGMHGPRFPIHPMMYHGQYPYMHPYMPYYPQGYMNPAGDAGRMPYDNYYTTLNPFAEPWHPGSLQRPPMMQGSMYQDPSRSGQGQVETCATCCQRQQEEQKQQQKLQGEGHMCKHSPSNHGDNQLENSQGHRQGQSQGHGKNYNVSERNFEEEDYETKKGQKYQSTQSYDETNYQVNKGQGQRSKNQHEGQYEGHYEQYDKRTTGQLKDKTQHHKQEWQNSNAEYNGQKSWRGNRNEYDQEGGWSVSDDQAGCYDDYDDKDEGEPYQYDYDEGYQNQYGRAEHRQHKQMRNKEEMYQQSLNQQQACYTGKGESHGVKKHPKIPILYPKEPSAKLHRQSLKNLQERRNTLLAQLQELNKQVEGHYNDKEEMLEEIWSEDTRKLEEKGFSVDESLPDLFRPQYELIQVDESEAYARTLEHPHPLDVGPVSLKAELISNGDIFERLGAISGVPPRAVNDSIMTSLMTSSLNNEATKDKEDYSYINTSMTDTADTKVQNTYMFNSQPVNKPVNKPTEENMSPRERKKSTDGWRNIDKDFPYWKDVTSNLESPMPTPPTTPKPATVHHNLPTLSHQSIVHNQSTITASSATTPYVSSSYIASNYMSASVSQPNRNKPTAYHEGFTTSSSWDSHQGPKTSVPTTCRNISMTTIYNSVANYESNDDYTMKQTSYIPSSYSSKGNEASAYGSEDIYWTTNSQTTAYEPESPLAYFSSTSSDLTDHIPFVEGSPTISKFGPISRNKQGIKNPALLEAVADETVKTLPVTAVTPIEGPPLPNASTVPSRFTRDEEGQYSRKNAPAETKVTFDKVYSLWASEVNLLEQKAQEASTEDEKLSVKLQAVEMQITQLASEVNLLEQKAQEASTEDEKLSVKLQAVEMQITQLASEVNLLEQKAQEASTEDEKLSVKLQAVEMQITLKQQELKQAQAVNLNTSEYMKRERIPSSQK